MGRIADALKKAEEERRRHLQDDSGGAVALLDPPIAPTELDEPVADEAAETATPAAVKPVVASSQGLNEAVVPYYDRSSVISEQYRALRTRLLTLNPQNDHRVMAITSAIPREGKSVTTLNLGVVLAEIRHLKVVCVDGDFRRSSLARMLGVRGEPGLADVLQGQATIDEVIQATPVPNLYLVPAGRTKGRSAAELLSMKRTGNVIRRLQSEFHYTLIDTPPATTVTDVGIIGQLCTGVIMVVRLNVTPEPAAKRAVRLLHVNNIPIIGCLLIGRDQRGGEYGYAYNYYYYYRYYNHRDEDKKKRK